MVAISSQIGGLWCLDIWHQPNQPFSKDFFVFQVFAPETDHANWTCGMPRHTTGCGHTPTPAKPKNKNPTKWRIVNADGNIPSQKMLDSGSWDKTVLGFFITPYFGSGFWITLTPWFPSLHTTSSGCRCRLNSSNTFNAAIQALDLAGWSQTYLVGLLKGRNIYSFWCGISFLLRKMGVRISMR